MRHVLWILAAATLAVQLMLGVFSSEIVRTLAAAGWSPLRYSALLSLTVPAMLVLTAGAGVYAAGSARRGGWVALFCAALVLGLYGPYAAVVVVPFARLGPAVVTTLRMLDVVLDALVPVVALAYVLRYRSPHDYQVVTRVDGTS